MIPCTIMWLINRMQNHHATPIHNGNLVRQYVLLTHISHLFFYYLYYVQTFWSHSWTFGIFFGTPSTSETTTVTSKGEAICCWHVYTEHIIIDICSQGHSHHWGHQGHVLCISFLKFNFIFIFPLCISASKNVNIKLKNQIHKAHLIIMTSTRSRVTEVHIYVIH